MKTVLYLTIMLAIVSSVGYGQANTTLSNLTSPTAINHDLLPNSTNTINLGSAGISWRILHIDSSVYLKDSLFMHNAGTNNSFVGQRAGYSITTGSNNAAFGFHALYSADTGSFNSAFGGFALSKSTGSNNTAVGHRALNVNSSGAANTAVGTRALYRNNNGSNNMAVGFEALYANLSGSRNTATGIRSLYSNRTGHCNTAMGDSALFANTSGSNNTANGDHALSSNTSGYNNVAIGVRALYSNTRRGNLVAVGEYALYHNGAGTVKPDEAVWNTAIGSYALYANTSGFYNTANGKDALYSNTIGYENTAIGLRALSGNIGGSTNTAVGKYALIQNTHGSNNVAIGSEALFSNTIGGGNTVVGASSDVGVDLRTNLSNATAIGAATYADADNKVRIGNTRVTSIGGQVGWTSFSDGRYKKNVKQDVQGLAFINSLQPITYTVDINGLDKYFEKGRKHDSSYEKLKAIIKKSAEGASNTIYNGFIAQDVEKAAAKLNYNFSGVDKPQSKDGLYGLRYADFVVPLVKAVQELDKRTESIATDKQRINDLETEVKQLKQLVQSLIQTKTVNGSNSYLSQNTPNPTNGSTVIPFEIATGSRTAAIQIIQTGSGKILKTIAVDVNAKQTTLNAASFAAGSYMYVLIVDGRQADSKQMILTK